MALLRSAVLLVGAAAGLCATPMFVVGDLLYVSTADSRIFEVGPKSSNVNGSGATPVATVAHQQFGQMAFSADGQTAYVTTWDGFVMSVSNTGQVKQFASGINTPTGLIRTSAGRLLVASYNDGKIFDITDGGNFSAATAYAWGLTTPRGLVETPDGIYVAEQSARQITNIGSGGNLTSTAAYATLESPTALAYFNGKLYAVDNQIGQVFEIKPGANSTTNPYAKGRPFTSLAVANGKMYAGTGVLNGVMANSGIWDISVTGDYKSTLGLIYNLPSADSMLGVVPAAEVQLPAQTPEPGTMMSGLVLVLLGSMSKRCRRD